jgi:hypothetical protein
MSKRLACALLLSHRVSEQSTSSPADVSGSIAGEFVKARIAAFGRAHRMLRLCKVCLDREVAARRMSPAPRHMESSEIFDPLRDWCFLCGALAPTLPALPRAARNGRRAA